MKAFQLLNEPDENERASALAELRRRFMHAMGAEDVQGFEDGMDAYAVLSFGEMRPAYTMRQAACFLHRVEEDFRSPPTPAAVGVLLVAPEGDQLALRLDHVKVCSRCGARHTARDLERLGTIGPQGEFNLVNCQCAGTMAITCPPPAGDARG